jgi:aminopeptidase-like protein
MGQRQREHDTSGERAWRSVCELHARDRWSSFDRYAESIAWCAAALQEVGVAEIERHAFPADGRTAFADWVMPLAWEVRAAALDLIEPAPRRLAEYGVHPQSLVMWSAPTGPEGVEGELLLLDAPEQVRELDLRGRIVFTPGHPTEIKAAVAAGGGLGIVSDWLKARDLPDERQWINTWSDAPGGWAMHERDSRLWGFTLSPREGARLREEARRSPVRLRVRVDTRLYADEIGTVTGLLRGNSDEEVLLMAHVNEQGANDNAAGAAVVLEAARQLASECAIQPMRRCVRFMLMPESYGTIAWATSNRERLRRTVVTLNVDSGAGAYDSDDSVLEVFANPLCCPNYADAILVDTVRSHYEEQGRREKWRLRRYSLAGDNFFCDPLIAVPHPWLSMGDGGDFWHNSADTPERVDSRSLGDLTAIIARFTRFMATADPATIASTARAARERLPEPDRALLRFPDDPPLLERPFPGPVPRRSRIGALTLDPLPPERWGPIAASPRWWGPQLAAWWWANGTRTTGDIATLIEREIGDRASFDADGFFAWLETVGYVRMERSR